MTFREVYEVLFKRNYLGYLFVALLLPLDLIPWVPASNFQVVIPGWLPLEVVSGAAIIALIMLVALQMATALMFGRFITEIIKDRRRRAEDKALIEAIYPVALGMQRAQQRRKK